MHTRSLSVCHTPRYLLTLLVFPLTPCSVGSWGASGGAGVAMETFSFVNTDLIFGPIEPYYTITRLSDYRLGQKDKGQI